MPQRHIDQNTPRASMIATEEEIEKLRIRELEFLV